MVKPGKFAPGNTAVFLICVKKRNCSVSYLNCFLSRHLNFQRSWIHLSWNYHLNSFGWNYCWNYCLVGCRNCCFGLSCCYWVDCRNYCWNYCLAGCRNWYFWKSCYWVDCMSCCCFCWLSWVLYSWSCCLLTNRNSLPYWNLTLSLALYNLEYKSLFELKFLWYSDQMNYLDELFERLHCLC